MTTPKITDVKKGISALWETLQCPICMDLLTLPVSTDCEHQFCKFCMKKLMATSKQNVVSCPVCKAKVTRRSLSENPSFQGLVAGLQGMIQAYEHDSCRNVPNCLPQPNKDSNCTDAETTTCDPNTSSGTELGNQKRADEDNLPQSNSSTVAANNGFGRLMRFDPSFSSPSDDKDQGQPPTPDKKISVLTDNLELTRVEMPEVIEKDTSTQKSRFIKSPCPFPTPDESERLHSRKSNKKKQKKDPDKILEQKKKKSLEKVAEWLMKVPTEVDFEELDDDGEDSDSCSSTATIDIKPQISDANPRSEDPAKTLEKQVFGAVYKRERRGNRASSGPPNTFEDGLIPPGLVGYSENGTEDEQEMTEETNDICIEFSEEPMAVLEENGTETHQDELNHLQSVQIKDKHDSPPPVSEIKTIKRTRSAVQQVDKDLKEQAQAMSGHNHKTEGKNKKSNKSRSTRLLRPLVLIEVQNGEASPKTRERSENVQVQIENYSSSEDQGATLTPRVRRSNRLKVSSEEPEKTCNVTKNSKNDKGKALFNSKSPKKGRKNKPTITNGCVYDQDIGGIENLSGQKPTQVLQDQIEEVTGLEKVSEVPPACLVSNVPHFKSPTNADVVGPTFESDKLPNTPPRTMQPETSVGETNCAGIEKEEDKNDYEPDTEQLLKSFKATKRKSFHLGGADVMESSSKKAKQTEKKCLVLEPTQPIETENLCYGDMISPSNSPTTRVLEKFVVESPVLDSSCSGQGFASGNVRSSLSSALPPNQESKCQLEGLLGSVVTQVSDSGLSLSGVQLEGISKASKSSQLTGTQFKCTTRDKVKKKVDCIASGESNSVTRAEQVLFSDSSSSPEDLITSQFQNVHKVKTNRSGEASTFSSINSNRKRNKRATRLNSTSESDSSGSDEDLPTLAQVFAPPACPLHQGQRDATEANTSEVEQAKAERLELHSHSCPSPDCISPSQTSVDLFGTPEECEVPVNNTEVSMESSQFSSEVLVTQQKIEMQKELERLGKMIALVSEVLEKKDSPSKEVPRHTSQGNKATGPVARGSIQCDQDANQNSNGKDLANGEQHSNPGSSVDKEVAQPSRSQHGGITAAGLNESPGVIPDGQEDKENNSPPKDGCTVKMVLVSSGLGSNEQILVKKFAKKIGARWSSQVTADVTHVIMHTDQHLVCERTLKYFLGIAGRKWVVSFQWISECFKQKKFLDESAFEVRGDTVNGPNHRGPWRARTAEDCNLLMKGYKIFLQGPFTNMSTDELEWMVELCGATVVKDPILFDANQNSNQLVIVPNREEMSAYSDLSRRATVMTRSWLLDSVGTYTLQNYSHYTA